MFYSHRIYFSTAKTTRQTTTKQPPNCAGTRDFQSTVGGIIQLPETGENLEQQDPCNDALCQVIAVALFSDREYENPNEEFTVTLHDLTYSSVSIPEVVLSSGLKTTTITIEDDGDMGTVSWCEYSCTTSTCVQEESFTQARTTPKCDAFSQTAPWPQSSTSARELKLCGATGNLQCNKLPDGVKYYYQVAEGTDFTVAYKRWGQSGFDEQLHFSLIMKHETAGADQASIDLGFDAIQRDSSKECYASTQLVADRMSRFVPFYNNGNDANGDVLMANADTSKDVVIDECTLSLAGTNIRDKLNPTKLQVTEMSANPFSNPSDGQDPTTSMGELRNNWWYTYFKFTAVDDNNILADQVFSMELTLKSTSEYNAKTQKDDTTLHNAGVTFLQDRRKVAIYIVDNDGGKAAVCKSRACIVCTNYKTSGECDTVTDTTSEYLFNIPKVIEGEESVQFFVVLKVSPTKPVYITLTPTSNVYQLRGDQAIGFGKPGASMMLTFKKSNWAQPQAVNVLATEDDTNRGSTYSGTIEFTSQSDQAAFGDTLEFYSLGNRAQSAAGFVLSGALTDNDVGEVIQFALDNNDGK